MNDPGLLPWRAGRKVGRTIYAMRAADATDEDALIGVMDTPVLAALTVQAHNATLPAARPVLVTVSGKLTEDDAARIKRAIAEAQGQVIAVAVAAERERIARLAEAKGAFVLSLPESPTSGNAAIWGDGHVPPLALPFADLIRSEPAP